MNLRYDEVVRSGIAKQVAENIKSAILDGRLKIDERLPTEEDLARSFGISRPTVREALKRLAAQNLIHSRRGPLGGNFVMRPDPEGLSKAITGAATLLVGIGAFDIDRSLPQGLRRKPSAAGLPAKTAAKRDCRLWPLRSPCSGIRISATKISALPMYGSIAPWSTRPAMAP